MLSWIMDPRFMNATGENYVDEGDRSRNPGSSRNRGVTASALPGKLQKRVQLKIPGDPHVMRMLVLGAGLQGSACAYDLLQNPEVKEVRLADLHTGHLPHFLAPYSGEWLIFTTIEVRDKEAFLALMRQSDAAMSAIPYYFNYDLAKMAVEAGVHFSDLGGNTEIVF